MDDFKTKLQDGTANYQVTFHKIRIPTGWKFYVTLMNDGEINTSFDMMKDGDGWKLVPPVPAWINEKEEELSGIINSNIDV